VSVVIGKAIGAEDGAVLRKYYTAFGGQLFLIDAINARSFDLSHACAIARCGRGRPLQIAGEALALADGIVELGMRGWPYDLRVGRAQQRHTDGQRQCHRDHRGATGSKMGAVINFAQIFDQKNQ
jgi:hypothetical protein